MSDALSLPPPSGTPPTSANQTIDHPDWRTQPEIGADRQTFLLAHRSTTPDIQRGTYPFAGISLSRADLEWLLVTHESGGFHGPVDWSDPAQRDRVGIDLRGADLRQADLAGLPLARVRFGLNFREWAIASPEQRMAAAAMVRTGVSLQQTHLEGAILNSVHLEGANLSQAFLEDASLIQTSLRQAVLIGIQLVGADLFQAHLERASLVKANLRGASMSEARLDGATMTGIDLHGAYLYDTHLDGANLIGASLENANLIGAFLPETKLVEARLCNADLSRVQATKAIFTKADLTGATLRQACLEQAELQETNLRNANLESAQLGGTSLTAAHLEGANLKRAHLEGVAPVRKRLHISRKVPTPVLLTNLRGAFLDVATSLDSIVLRTRQCGSARLADVHWGSADLAVVSWTQKRRFWMGVGPIILGDEQIARARLDSSGKPKGARIRIREYETAVHAYRQLATSLRDQGLNEDADRFSYRAHVCQRHVLYRQGSLLRCLGSWVLSCIAGYGYKPGRSLLVYIAIILGFTGLYLLNSQFVMPHLAWDEALVFSLSSFHGRGFFSSDIHLGDTYARLAVAEAVLGLMVEISFIATFTQRFFGK